mgnify:CR=1 FL=1
MTAGIFQKPCPACAMLLAREATSCECGYLFDAEDADADEAQQLMQEELFETYLTARVQQSIADLEAARAVLASAPTDTKRAYALLRQVQVLHQQRLELSAQQEKIAALRERHATGAASDEFRAAQAARAAQIVERQATPATCVHCGAAIAPDVGRCTCPAAVNVFVDSAALGTTLRRS